jgi:hypothetical protein
MEITKNEQTSNARNQNEENDSIKYHVEKMTFVVNPIFRESGDTLEKILIKLMQKEVEKP